MRELSEEKKSSTIGSRRSGGGGGLGLSLPGGLDAANGGSVLHDIHEVDDDDDDDDSNGWVREEKKTQRRFNLEQQFIVHMYKSRRKKKLNGGLTWNNSTYVQVATNKKTQWRLRTILC